MPRSFVFSRLKFFTFAVFSCAIAVIYVINHGTQITVFSVHQTYNQTNKALRLTPPENLAPKQACIHPPIKMDDPVMMSYYKKFPPPVCKGEENWVYVDNGTLRFSKSVVEKYGNFTCDFYNLVRIHEREVTWGSVYVNISEGYRIPTDFFKVICKSEDRHRYEGIHAGVAYTHDRANRPEVELTEGLGGVSVVLLGHDSLSRLSWMRHLPQTREYFLSLGAIELESHNIVGDGTTAVMFPMLTGRFERELPECGLNEKGAIPLDDFPFLWHDFKRAGYLTSWAEGLSGAFTWRMLGFSQQPTDFFTRPFFYSLKQGREFNAPCIGSQRTHQVWMNYFRDIFLMYRNKRKFLVHFFSEMSHWDNNLITRIDGELKDYLQFLHDGGYLNNTLLILLSDHGARYGDMRSTWQGKVEERLPYFSFLFPKWFEEKYPKAIQNLRTNTHRLTTPFDIHETLKDFLRFGGTEVGNVSNRGISLFKEIPLDRTCEHAQIEPHWCACLAWQNVSSADPFVQNVTKFAVGYINSLTSAFRSECAELNIENVTESLILKSRKELLKHSKYKNSNDMTLFQLTFFTTPGHGHFEVTVTYDNVRDTMAISEREISRINKYGNDAACIYNKNNDIRPYCYCIKDVTSMV
ncbi:uncharacterized protein LOC131937493 [Physella acuta]|uniref:uncharacterized protein LOC131937493 n=1 Tax=Physella acuta TaxID=109671 RepID=UPI0027DAD9A4|nr:uncharacterized protein LOC131937493 [Physella acuta]